MSFNFKKCLFATTAIITLTLTILLMHLYISFPEKLMLTEGEQYVYNVLPPFNVDAQPGNNLISNDTIFNYKKPLLISAANQGKYLVDFKLFGILPFKAVAIDVLPKTSVIPSGMAVGVKINTDGVLVTGTTDIDTEKGKINPAKNAGLKVGDFIQSINGEQLENIDHLTKVIESSGGNPLSADVKRNDEVKTLTITPSFSSENENFKIGAIVRDSTAGIGTMTFIDPETKYFGALGHGIMDTDTNELLSVGKGKIFNSTIVSIKKGEKGDPGELKGAFINQDEGIGVIKENSPFGIFGKITDENALQQDAMPVATRSQAKEGPATILCSIDGKNVEEFEVEIQKIMYQASESSKGMVLKVTDERLLEETGGIIQGMSGSPIIQDGKLIGAVTHVFINDPTKGYGIFIEWMLNKIPKEE